VGTTVPGNCHSFGRIRGFNVICGSVLVHGAVADFLLLIVAFRPSPTSRVLPITCLLPPDISCSDPITVSIGIAASLSLRSRFDRWLHPCFHSCAYFLETVSDSWRRSLLAQTRLPSVDLGHLVFLCSPLARHIPKVRILEPSPVSIAHTGGKAPRRPNKPDAGKLVGRSREPTQGGEAHINNVTASVDADEQRRGRSVGVDLRLNVFLL